MLDIETWIKDSAAFATNQFEKFTEVVLELSTIELLGIQPIVERYLGEPWQGYDPAVEAGVSNARLGYAIRNRETQLIECYGVVLAGDPLAELAAERAENSGINTAVVYRLVQDAIGFERAQLSTRLPAQPHKSGEQCSTTGPASTSAATTLGLERLSRPRCSNRATSYTVFSRSLPGYLEQW